MITTTETIPDQFGDQYANHNTDADGPTTAIGGIHDDPLGAEVGRFAHDTPDCGRFVGRSEPNGHGADV